MTRTTRILVALGVFLGGLLLFAGITFFVGGGGVITQVTSSAIGGPFKLVDQDGKPVTEQVLKGRPTLIFFGFTHCPDVCPTALFEMSEILGKLGPDAGRVGIYFVSVDPERDTPAVLKDYLSSFDPHLHGLTGTPEAIAAIMKAYRVYAKKVPLEGGDYTMDHSALVYLMDKEGRFVAPFNMKRPPEEAAADLRRYL
jgi:protein SCO1/2